MGLAEWAVTPFVARDFYPRQQEPFRHFHLEYQNSMKSADLKRGNPRLTQLSRLEKEMESMKEEFHKELDPLKYDIHSMREDILNEIRVRHTRKSFTQE